MTPKVIRTTIWVAWTVCASFSVGASDFSTIKVYVEGVERAAPAVIRAFTPENTVEVSLEAGSQCPARLRLEGDRMWDISASADGYWAPGLTRFVRANESDEIVIRLWPTGTIEGQFKAPKGDEASETVTVLFRRPPDIEESGPSSGELACVVSKSDFRCFVPVGTWDCRVRARGFVSHYFWGASVVAEDPLGLGTLELKRGGSVTGFLVLDGSRSASLEGCTVELREPKTGIQSLDVEARTSVRVITGRPNRRGFFHLQGVAPGVYEFIARHPKLAPERVFPVEVFKNAETEIRPAVRLQAFSSLEVIIEPPEDIWYRPWKVKILDWRLENPLIAYAAEGVAEGGLFRANRLTRGVFMVQVQDADGSKWTTERVELDGGSVRLTLEIDMVPVKGTVHLGDLPLASELSFTEAPPPGTEDDVPWRRVGPVFSDEEGAFETWLPLEGQYKVVVKSETPRIRRTVSGIEVRQASGQPFARVEIALPDVDLQGVVVDSEGTPVPAARVEVMSLPAAGWEVLTSDKEGEFEAVGLVPGAFRVQAFEGSRASEPVNVRVAEDHSPDPVKLILTEQPALHGRVFDEEGGVVGARVEAIVAGKTEHTITEIDGAYSFVLPGLLGRNVPFAVLSPGRALRLGRAVVEIDGAPYDIRLSRSGGSLEIKNVSAGERRVLIWLLGHNGVIFGSSLDQWASLHGLPILSGAPEAIVPAVEPGQYTVCGVTIEEAMDLLPAVTVSPVDAITAWANATPEACAGGYLQIGGTLELELPAH
ncbi:MAG: carboxypeptidase-like regulatory domain-containing protein [Thermoanaerobaculales bacterium]|nr:carboxypeptidase-like regulatory domain-containing protein [Thermoanaerobaculales bacterium]